MTSEDIDRDGGSGVVETDSGKDSSSEERYKIIFEGGACIGTGKCAEVSDNWDMDIATGKARPDSHFFGEEDLDHNLKAARVCPAKNGEGVIRVLDTETGEELDGERME
ncbi:MAG: ferredoxin [Halobacteria archaeon]